jgi:methionine aminotransferase
MIVLNTPHNPTGAVLSWEDVRELTATVEGTGMLILSDEVYEHIIFDGIRHESMARHDPLAGRSFIVGSFGKTYHTTGWKVGYVVAPAAMSAEFRKVHQFVTFSTNTPVQLGLADHLSSRRGLDDIAAFFQAKRDLFLRLMEGSRFRPLRSRGSYFQLMDYSGITDEADAEFSLRLTREYGVASIPTSPFLYRAPAPRVLRFCFAKKDETLRSALERLQRARAA